MKDIQFLFSAVSLFVGAASISISIFVYKSNKIRALFYFIALNISFFIIQNSIPLNIYAAGMGDSDWLITDLSKFMDALGTSCSSLFGLFLINSLFGKKITLLQKSIFIGVFSFQFSAIIICYLNENLDMLRYIGKTSLIAVIAYEILMTLLNYRLIADKELKKALRIFGLISLVFFPTFIIEVFRMEIPFLKDMNILKMFSLPSFFLVINVYTLHLANTYFNSPAYLENNKLTNYFIKKYGITDKETEVIELLLAGLTYKQIAEKLVIAPKTADNHVQNIYKKLEVTSKIQLSNLIRSKTV